MKTLALLAVCTVGLLSFSSGCSTPAYSPQERFQLIGRNWGYEYEQIQDDIDGIFLLQPTAHLTRWNLQ